MKSSFKLIFFGFLFLVFGCKKNTVTKQNEKNHNENQTKKILIGFSLDTLAIERWQRDLDIFMNKVKELNADVIIQNAGNSAEEQNRQILYLIEKKVDVIVVLPKESEKISESLKKAKEDGIPLIAYDRLILNSDIDLYITIDSEAVGEQMALGLLNRTNGRKWFCILGPQEDYNMTLIRQGVYKVIKHTPVKIEHIFYTDDWNYDLANQEMIRLIKEDNIPNAIICGNDAVASSVLFALSRYHSDYDIKICGQDAEILACQNIIQGKQAFTIYKPITKLAEISAECAVQLAKGEFFNESKYQIQKVNNGLKEVSSILLHPTLVSKENLDEVIIESGFHTRNLIYED